MISLKLTSLVFLLLVTADGPDCDNLINFAKELYLDTAQPEIWSSLILDCCDAKGVECDDNARVTKITWNSLELNGDIHAEYLPPLVTFLDLSYNQLIGSIPLALPNTLLSLYLNNNLLSGPIPPNLPSSITSLNFLDNDLSGSVPNTLPSSLEWIDIQQNQLTGGIPTNLPSGLQFFDVSDNFLTGSIPTTLPQNIVYLYLDHNRLSGDVPALPSTIEYLSLGFFGRTGNHFTGTLRLNKPIALYINDNWITDVVVQDASQIAECDLSNNPLLNNPNIDNLIRCTKNGLYSLAELPVTKSTSKTVTTKTLSTLKSTTTLQKATNKVSTSFYTSNYVSMTTFKSYLTSLVIATTDLTRNVDLLLSSYSPNYESMTTSDSYESMTASDSYEASNVTEMYSTSMPVVTPDSLGPAGTELQVDPFLVYGILGALAGLCILVVIGSFIFKHPKMHSKYGRKNSFGTLNTVATGKTNKSV